MTKESFKGLSRKAVLATSLALPLGAAASGCVDGPQEIPAKITTIKGQEIENGSTKDSDYNFKVTVQTGSWSLEQAVEFYTNEKPEITNATNIPAVRLPAPVFYPKDEHGRSLGFSNHDNSRISELTFQIKEGGIVVAKRYESKNAKDGLSTKTSDYKFKVTTQVEIDGANSATVEVYTNTEPKVDNTGILPIINIDGAYCPEDQEEAQIGCSDKDRHFESMTIIGGFGSTVIEPNPGYKAR